MRGGVYVRVSTDDQRDNGYSIDSQLRMIKEYCEKNNYDIIDVYNDAGHSGKDLMRPEMQRLLKDIKSHKIEVIVAIKVDRLTRNNYDGFWFLNYCENMMSKLKLRTSAIEFFYKTYKNDIPVIIVSAGIENTIEEFLKLNNINYSNISIISYKTLVPCWFYSNR